jgi:hypothetical protein
MQAALERLRRRLGRRRQAEDVADALVGVAEPDRRIVEAALPYTMTGAPRLLALIDAVRYLAGRRLPGDLAECGVWRGGSVLAMILALRDAGEEPRDIHLFDTFSGMTEPSVHDTSPFDPPALETWRTAKERGGRPWPDLFDPSMFSVGTVEATLLGTGYPRDRLHFVVGAVEETLPAQAPAELALLRLDTDWYESTRHELEHLYPRLVPGGVLIIDDYGHWEGARRAVEEYFREHPPRPLLSRIDYTGRVALKP